LNYIKFQFVKDGKQIITTEHINENSFEYVFANKVLIYF